MSPRDLEEPTPPIRYAAGGCALVALVVLALDLGLPAGAYHGLPYLLVVLVAHLGHRRSLLLWSTSAASLLVLAGWLLSSAERQDGSALGHRAIAVVLLWTVAAILLARDRAEESRSESEKKFRLIFEASPDAVLMIDPRGTITLVNRRGLELFGYGKEDLVGRGVEILVPPSWREAHAEARAAFGRQPFHRPIDEGAGLSARRSDGTVFPAEIGLEPLTTPEGSMVMVTVRDVSARKRAEARAESSLRRYYGLFDQSPNPVMVLDPRTLKPLEFNDAAVEILGYGAHELMSIPIWEHMLARGELAVREHFEGVGERTSSRFETRLRTKGRELKDVVARIRRMELDGKTVLYVIFEDITERNRAEEARRKLEIQVRDAQRMEALGTLAGGIAHDFNNILQAIVGFGEEVRLRVSDDLLAEGCMDEILRACGRAKDLVSQILTFSRRERKVEGAIDVAEIVAEAGRLLRASLPRNLDLRIELPDDDCVILGDPSQIHQIMLNLATNAAHAIGDAVGEIGIRVDKVVLDPEDAGEIPGASAGSHVRIEVRDNGRGMDEATLPRIFDPFFTTKAEKGTGLGLSTVHGAVLGHGGGITVESRVGDGTVFRIYLPSPTIAADRTRIVADIAEVGRGHVLLVDDQAEVGRVGELVLRRYGYDVTHVTCPCEAWDRFEADPSAFDLVLTDQSMPSLTGLQLARRIRGVSEDIPIVLTTGFHASVSDESLRDAGITELIMKPWNAKELATTVQRAMRVVPAVDTSTKGTGSAA